MDFLIFTIIVFPSVLLIAVICRMLRKKGYGPQLDAAAKKMRNFKDRYAPGVARIAINSSRVFNKNSPLGTQSNDKTLNTLTDEVKKLTDRLERLNK